MIIIVEGIDRVGKTTLVNKLNDKLKNVIKLKDYNVCSKDYTDEDFSQFSLGKLDTSVAFLKQLSEQGFNIIIDRLHLTEITYGLIDRKVTESEKIAQLDTILSGLNAILITVMPTDIKWSNAQAEKDLTKHLEAFIMLHDCSEIEKYTTNFHELDKTVEIILNRVCAINASLCDSMLFATATFGKDVLDTVELVNENTTYNDITTHEILKTFNIDKDLSDNFEKDVISKSIDVHGAYQMKRYSDVFDKIKVALEQIKLDNIFTRRCIIQFDIDHCFQNIQFLIRENKLHVICNMRSCNAVVNYKADIYICSVLADNFKKELRKMTNVQLDETHDITMNIGSLHIFNEMGETENASE